MEDYKIILYILAAVAYFVVSQWRKAFKTPDDKSPEVKPKRTVASQPQQRPAQPVTSFEDILKELQPKAEKAKSQGKTLVQDAREFVGEKVLPPLATESAQPVFNKYNSYEEKPERARSWEKRAEAIEAAKNSKFREQKSFVPNEKAVELKPSRFAALLRNPSSVRDAVILTEIFNRKYN
ncbi:hypothetical protein [Pontibacter rugosus]|uniref:Uncharacterized protein n=1 Tax=Pontibacter rugosus TaxID=1745966 RepID=A0ABW3SWI6_9BACT